MEAARYGLSVGDIQNTIMTAIGGMNITQTVEGLERYLVNLRYMPELRDDPDKLAQVLALPGWRLRPETSMLAYLDEVYHRRMRDGRMNSIQDLYDRIIEGEVLRVRLKLMTVATTVIGLMPVMIGNVFESCSEVMQRISAPMVGGLISATVLTLLILPAIYMVWKSVLIRSRHRP